jgi:hypothetical protein
MGRRISVSAVDATTMAGPGESHNRWIADSAVDYESDPLDMLIRAEERGAVIPITGVLAWPYPGQDMEREPNPLGETPSLYVGVCACCGGSKNRNRWCAVCAPTTPGVKALPRDAKKKYVKPAGGMRGGIGA